MTENFDNSVVPTNHILDKDYIKNNLDKNEDLTSEQNEIREIKDDKNDKNVDKNNKSENYSIEEKINKNKYLDLKITKLHKNNDYFDKKPPNSEICSSIEHQIDELLSENNHCDRNETEQTTFENTNIFNKNVFENQNNVTEITKEPDIVISNENLGHTISNYQSNTNNENTNFVNNEKETNENKTRAPYGDKNEFFSEHCEINAFDREKSAVTVRIVPESNFTNSKNEVIISQNEFLGSKNDTLVSNSVLLIENNSNIQKMDTTEHSENIPEISENDFNDSKIETISKNYLVAQKNDFLFENCEKNVSDKQINDTTELSFEEIPETSENNYADLKNDVSASENKFLVLENEFLVSKNDYMVENCENNVCDGQKSDKISPKKIREASFENDYSGSKSDVSQSTDQKSDINSSKSNISEDETDDPLPDNISLSLSIFQEENEKLKSIIENLELIVSQQQKKLNDNDLKIRDFEQNIIHSEKIRLDLENRLHLAIKQCEFATKEKESTVMRYAVSEKAVLEQKSIREQTERKLVETMKEKDLVQHKLSAMVQEKARICQLLDNKTYEYKSVAQELERTKSELNNLEVKLKWSQNSLRTEIELHKESASKVDQLTSKLNEVNHEIEKIKKDTQETMKNFYQSQENRAHVLDSQLKEQQAILILEKHEREERDLQINNLKTELDKLQNKHQNLIGENNSLSLKVQQLERERLENNQKLSELKGCADKLKQEEATLNSLTANIEQLELQLQHEREQKEVNYQQLTHLKARNSELENDMESCRSRESEMLIFTQQLTDKNVRLQSEFGSLETKVQQLTCEQNILKKNLKKYETQIEILNSDLEKEKNLRSEENQVLARHLAEKTKICEQLSQQLEDQKGENLVIKRKLELSVREVNKELQQCRKKIENYEKIDNSNSRSSSSSSLNVTENPSSSNSPICHENSDHQIIQPENVLDRQVLIDHIIKLQRTSAKKSEKIDFLEEHVQTLVAELQRKSKLLQSYVLREQAGTLSSNKMDENKAEIAKHNGSIMASVFGSKINDNSLTLELSLDINRKLQAILEDTLLKNITLKENVDTLGAEIERLNKKN